MGDMRVEQAYAVDDDGLVDLVENVLAQCLTEFVSELVAWDRRRAT